MTNTPPPIGPGRLRQTEIYVTGLGGKLPLVPVAPAALESAASHAMPKKAFAYVAGGAGMEATMAANRAALDRRAIVPRMLKDASARDTTVELFGRRHPNPLLLAPIGVLEMAHREAERAVARAAKREQVGMVFSNQASVPMEEVATLLGDTPHWFQLYWSADDDLTRSLIKRAENCGCEAIVLTLDTTILGWRPRDLDVASLPFLRGQGLAQYLSDPVFKSKLAAPPPSPFRPRGFDLVSALIDLAGAGRRYGLSVTEMRHAVARFVATYSRPDLVWDDVERLKAMTRLPVLLKGIQHADDAREAVKRGVDGIVVSNH
ncbi:MAG: alpha-hydroxy-acid oxidizing protein, partial [Alphaproteobacteria bacterium]